MRHKTSSSCTKLMNKYFQAKQTFTIRNNSCNHNKMFLGNKFEPICLKATGSK